MKKNFKYMDLVDDLFAEVNKSQSENIKEVAKLFVQNIKNNKIIHMFGTGHSHMIGIEMFVRAGGLANVNAMLDPDTITATGARRSGALERLSGLADIIYDNYKIEAGDIMIISSNSGRNSMPIEMALRAKSEGVYTIALTNLKQSKAAVSRHQSGKKLYEVVDFVLDNCVPDGDSLMSIAGIKTGPGSSLSSILILNTIVSEALMILAKEGKELPVFMSQNVDGFDNDSLYEKYEDRVKHF